MPYRHLFYGLAVGGALALGAVASAWFLAPAPVAPPPERAVPPVAAPGGHVTAGEHAADAQTLAELEALRRTLAQYGRDLAALKTALAHAQQGVQQPPAPAQPGGTRRHAPVRAPEDHDRRTADPVVTSGVQEEDPPDAEGYTAFYAEQLDTEPVDDAWQAQVQPAIAERLDALLAEQVLDGVTLTDTTCGTTLCRLTLSFADAETRQRWGGHVALAVPWAGQTYFHQDETDPSSMILYVAREGTALPLPEALTTP
jgi:hypothetical protein